MGHRKRLPSGDRRGACRDKVLAQAAALCLKVSWRVVCMLSIYDSLEEPISAAGTITITALVTTLQCPPYAVALYPLLCLHFAAVIFCFIGQLPRFLSCLASRPVKKQTVLGLPWAPRTSKFADLEMMLRQLG
jgi:hypothetical protein